jgi:Alr-MurF fusion protein
MGTDYSISAVAGIVKGTLISGNDDSIIVNELLIDSRRLSHPEKTLFVALVTSRNDGHHYIQELYEKGVRNFLVSKPPSPPPTPPPIEGGEGGVLGNFIVVSDTLIALQAFAAYHRSQFNIPVVGITGSNGKTIVKEWLYQLMNADKQIVRSPKSYNSQIGVPLSVLETSHDHNLAIFEAGISEPGEMEHLEPIIRPTIGIFTNIGHAHDENFLSSRQKTTEKLELFRHVETLIYSKDYQEIHQAVTRLSFLDKLNILTWSRKDPSDLLITGVITNSEHSTIKGLYKNEETGIVIPFTDEASVENAIHCWLLMLHLGYGQETIASRMINLAPIAMRLELKEGINNCSLINDSYSLDLNSLSIALDFLNHQKQHQHKTVILSDILQSGRDHGHLYAEVNQLLLNKGINRVIGIGKEISAQAWKFTVDSIFFNSTDDFLSRFPLSSFRDETILLKGARIFEFERISSVLQQKVHETVLEINLDALVHNLNYYKSKLDRETKIMAMVKAFSYGSGSFEIANLLQFHHINYLAVAYADEGVELRKSGITLPVMVMNPEEQSFDLLIKYDLEPEIYSLHTLEMLENTILKFNGTDKFPVKVHIKLDTGMHRLGFDRKDIDSLILRIKNNPEIHVQSLFSHLAASEDPHQDAFTHYQVALFREMSDRISTDLGYPVLRHILNSAGISRFPGDQMEMVRLGIGLYGVGFNAEEQGMLRNVSTLKSTISQMKFVGSDETVGYNRAGKLERDTVIAIVPIGYADGLNRKLGNGKGRLFIHGQPVPIIGNICMDLCMVDITDIPEDVEVQEGDEVIVFGDEYPLTQLAADLETIPYEILTSISRRVKRVYFHE